MKFVICWFSIIVLPTAEEVFATSSSSMRRSAVDSTTGHRKGSDESSNSTQQSPLEELSRMSRRLLVWKPRHPLVHMVRYVCTHNEKHVNCQGWCLCDVCLVALMTAAGSLVHIALMTLPPIQGDTRYHAIAIRLAERTIACHTVLRKLMGGQEQNTTQHAW